LLRPGFGSCAVVSAAVDALLPVTASLAALRLHLDYSVVSAAAGSQAALGCAVEEVEARLNDEVKKQAEGGLEAAMFVLVCIHVRVPARWVASYPLALKCPPARALLS
jgi:hypothetical protein